MTILIDRDQVISSPALAPTERDLAREHEPELTIGLVNNMPDPALKATERQFMRLVQSAAGKTFYDALKLITRLVNIGDAKSLACHPASTTHRQMSAEQQRVAGVLPETIRLSIGIEHVSDIIEDIDQALDKACRSARLEAAE